MLLEHKAPNSEHHQNSDNISIVWRPTGQKEYGLLYGMYKVLKDNVSESDNKKGNYNDFCSVY